MARGHATTQEDIVMLFDHIRDEMLRLHASGVEVEMIYQRGHYSASDPGDIVDHYEFNGANTFVVNSSGGYRETP